MHPKLLENVVAINPQEFITSLEPSLRDGRAEQAIEQIRARWSLSQILDFLGNGSADVRKVAALALSLVGGRIAVQPLAVALHDGDVMVSQVAEHALWSIWFRLGKLQAVCRVKCGNNHLHHGNYASAIEQFTQAVTEDPNFAEASNQRAIAYYLSERYAEAIEDCRRSLALMPQHFGAMSGMGHCHAHLGEWQQARRCYRLALAIHPRLEGIQSALDQVEQLLQESPAQ